MINYSTYFIYFICTGSCPASVAIGPTASGKSTSLQLIQNLLGGVLFSQSSGESITSELMKSTLPVYWDDPAHPKTLAMVLVATFQGGGKQTKGGGNEVPLSTFLATVNFSLDEDLRSVCDTYVWLLFPCGKKQSKKFIISLNCLRFIMSRIRIKH